MMDSGDSLLRSLEDCSDYRGLYQRFCSFLLPFGDLISLDSYNPSAAPSTTKKKNKNYKKPSSRTEIDPRRARPLAKQFLKFLCRSLQLLPSLLRGCSNRSRGEGGDDDDGKDGAAMELLGIYRLVLDCLACVSTCLDGKPYSVHLQRGPLVRCLEALGRYMEAEVEAVSLFESLRCVLSSVAPAAQAACHLPDAGFPGANDPELATLLVEVVVGIANCAFKSRKRDVVSYERILALLDEVQPWLSVLDPEVSRKYQASLVNAVYKCSVFLAEESRCFDAELVQQFCFGMLRECLRSSLRDRFPDIARKICCTIDPKWKSRPHLILDIFTLTLESILCGCKVEVVIVVNEFLELISYCADIFCEFGGDICSSASRLLQERAEELFHVSPSIASILHLYAIGFYIKSKFIQAEQCDDILPDSNISKVMLLEHTEDLQILNSSLYSAKHIFDITSSINEIISSRESKDLKSLPSEDRKPNKHEACKYEHGHASPLSCLDASEFLCKPLVEYVTTAWKKFVAETEFPRDSATTDYVQNSLQNFCDLFNASYRCAKISERDYGKLHEIRSTMLQVAIGAAKFSFVTGLKYENALEYVDHIISSEWIEPQELKFLCTSLHNIGASLYNIGHLKHASMSLHLCSKSIWRNVQLLCCTSRDKSKTIQASEDTTDNVIKDAFAKIALIVDVLHKCGASNVHEIVVQSLHNLTAAENTIRKDSSLVLVKQWVKIVCKDYEAVEVVDNAPLLYPLLSKYSSTWSIKALGNIIEQELLSYEVMEARKPILCQKLQLKVVNILLDEVYTGNDFCLQRSEFLIRKGRALRASGFENLNSCIECLSEAISLLKEKAENPPSNNDLVSTQLALAYCLRAQCAQEAYQDCKAVLHDIQCALSLWLSIDLHDSGLPGRINLAAQDTVTLFCSIADLLSLKGCSGLTFDIYKLIILFYKRESIQIGKCLTMLWSGKRLNHSLCTSPIDEDLILYISRELGIDGNSLDFWISCMKGSSSRICFLQKLLPCDSVLPDICIPDNEMHDWSKVTWDEVKKVAASLTSDVPLGSQSACVAGNLYYDLSERLLSNGMLLEALTFAREALRLRKRILNKNFISTSKKQPPKLAYPWKIGKNGHGRLCFEAVGVGFTEVWPDTTKPKNLEDYIPSPWSVLRCYLDSILQVASIHESIGNGIEAEVLLQSGQQISFLQRLPVFEITFTSLLGQLYRKKQLWDQAENELSSAKKLLMECDMTISCKRCKLAVEVFIDMQIGDLSRNRYEKGLQSKFAENLPCALGLYTSALQKLDQAELESSLELCKKPHTTSTLVKIDIGAKLGVLKHSELHSRQKETRLPECSICISCCEPNISQFEHRNFGLSSKGGEPCITMGRETRSKNAVKCISKEHIGKTESTTGRAQPKRQSCRNKATRVGEETHCEESSSQKLCPDTSDLDKSPKIQNGCSLMKLGCNEACVCGRIKCWRCLLIRVIKAGSMKNFIYLNWECHRRRLSLRLLLKIAKCLGARCGRKEAHKVHEIFWRCFSLLFDRKPLSDYYSGTAGSHLIKLVGEGDFENMFSVEHAVLLYNISWFSLKECLSENSRTCCCLSNIQIPSIVMWLFRAFLLCQELPSLSQKVSKLLAFIFLVSTLGGPISLPSCSGSSLSTSHWAAFFHQASIGASLQFQYLSRVRHKFYRAKPSEVLPNAFMDAAIKASKFLRYGSGKLDALEAFVKDFYHGLPSVPIICLSMFGGDYANLLGETLLLPSFFPSWLLLSRFSSTSQPIIMFLPADFIKEEIWVEGADSEDRLTDEKQGSTKKWECPWSDTTIDFIFPSYKILLEENFLSLTNTLPVPANAQLNYVTWWSQRIRLNNRLDKLLRNMEDSWLGPWGCLLLGGLSKCEHLDSVVRKMVSELELQCGSEADGNVLKAILGGAKSVVDAESCIYQLILYKGFFGRGGCCGKERFRAFDTNLHGDVESLRPTVHNLIEEAIGLHSEAVDREPIIFVLDSDVQMLPWENLPNLRNQEAYRMPSVGNICMALSRSCYIYNGIEQSSATYPSIDPLNAYYLLNPSGDLDRTQVEFEQWFNSQNWEGKAGNIPTTEELALALQNHDLFLYFGHGSGVQYISGHEIEKLDKCAATLLMGCSSGSLMQKGSYAPQGAPIFYLFAGSPAVIANLWEVTDKDIDRFGKAMLTSWLQEESRHTDTLTMPDKLVKDYGRMNISHETDGKLSKCKTRSQRAKNLLQNCHEGKCKVSRETKRIASFMSQAREACKLPLLIGASPVCYGVPTVLRKKSC